MAHWKERLFPGIPIENVAFSRDNRIIATSSKHTVTLFQYKTRNDPIHVECSSPVVSVCFNSADEFVTVTVDGEMTSWELQNDDVVKKSSRRVTAFPVKNVVWSHSKKHSAWVTEAEKDSENDTLSVLMNDQTLEAIDTVPRNLRKDQVAISGKFVAHCSGKNVTKIQLEREEDGESKEVFTHNSILLGLTAEENEKNVFERVAVYGDTIAASLAFGKVYIWSNLGDKPFTLTSAYTLHWHKVSAPMVITPYDGLVSAGAETVLCKWTLKGEKRPTLLSRLQAAVTGVVLSDDGSLVALLMEDNSLHIAVLSSMAISHSLPTITYSTRCPQSVFTSDSQVPDSVVMNGTPGWIQWFDLSSGGTREQACLSMDNAVEGDVDNGRLDQTYYQLEKVTLCPKSAASLEALVNFPQDYKRLRFWKRTSDLDAEIVNEVSVPFDTQFVSGCCDSPDLDELFITCGGSSAITLWKPNEDRTGWFKDAARSKSTWQKIPITAVSSISSKGVWASAHKSQENCHIVLWNVSEMTVLESFRTDGILNSLEWATNSLVLISTSNSVTCWNLETLSPKWIVEQPLDCHVSSLGCFGWENNHVIQFDPSTGALLDSVKFTSNIESLVAVKYRNGLALVAKTEKGLAMLSSVEDHDANRVQITKETPFSRLAIIPSATAVTRTAKGCEGDCPKCNMRVPK